MITNRLKKIVNPYEYDSCKLSQNEFIGREKDVEKLELILNEYIETFKLNNLVINGEKSIGKSTLLNRYEQVLRDYGFVTYSKELLRNYTEDYNEFEFFKELISDIFYRFAPVDNTCLDSLQQEIWYTLTEQNMSHSSTFLQREINFATLYANKINNYNVKFSEKSIETDIEKIIDTLTSAELGYNGLAILIDEFQELNNNLFLLDTLRKLSENLSCLIIIGAGLPSIVSSSSFEKFNRSSTSINLQPLDKYEILDLIYKPIEVKAKLSRFEVQSCIDKKVVHEIINKTDGNPHHIKGCDCKKSLS